MGFSTPVMVSALLAAAQDTIVVRADNPPSWGDAIEVVEQTRMGSLDGLDGPAFGRIVGVAQLPGGGTAVADGQTASVSVFDASGRMVREFGSSGGGPGEFRALMGLERAPTGELVTWDSELMRVSYFSEQGAFVRSFQVEMTVFLGGPGPSLQVDRYGGVYLLTSGELPHPRTGRPREAVVAYLKYRSDGMFVDSVIPPRRQLDGVLARSAGPGGTVAPFQVQTISVLTSDGTVVSGRNAEYHLERQVAPGRYVRIERSYEPVVVGRAERADWDAHRRRWDEVWEMTSPAVPETKLPFVDLWIDTDDRLWVRRSTSAEHYPVEDPEPGERRGIGRVEWQARPTFDLIELGGTFLGTVVLPWNTELAASSGRRFWTVQRGEFDEEYVVVYEMR